MELKIISPGAEGFVKAIEWNHEEIKAEMAAKVADYKMMVYSDDQITEAKKDRAELNKMVTALEDKRKEIKALCLDPYNKFEKQMKELVEIVKEPIGIIDKQVKEYEEEQRAKKVEEIKAYYATKECDIDLDKFYDKKWENTTVKIKAIKEQIDAKVEEINADLKILADEPDYQYEALEAYKNTLDIRYALGEIKRLKELAEKKAQFEAQKRAEAEKQPIVEDTPTQETKEETSTGTTEPQDNFIPNFGEIGDNRHWLTIKIHLDTAEHAELLAYLDEKRIDYTVL